MTKRDAPFAKMSGWMPNRRLFERMDRTNPQRAFKRWMIHVCNTYTLASKPMGEPSAHGTVYTIEPTDKADDRSTLYVLKRVQTVLGYFTIGDINALKAQLTTEATIGMDPDAPVPLVWAYRVENDFVEIVMENVHKTRTMKREFVIEPLQLYMNDRHMSTWKTLVPLFHNTMLAFYKTTRHFHGDLHFNNVYVIRNHHGDLEGIKVIDLGSVVPFVPAQYLSLERAVSLAEVSVLITQVFTKLKKRNDFDYRETQPNYGEIVWLKGDTSVMHNFRRVSRIQQLFWKEVLNFGGVRRHFIKRLWDAFHEQRKTGKVNSRKST